MSAQFPFHPQGPHTTPENDQAAHVLQWLDQWLPTLAARQKLGAAYQQARHAVGPLLQGNARAFPGGPTIPGFKLPVIGTGDEAHGVTRVEALIRQVIVPLIAQGEFDDGRVRELLERLRGSLAMQYRQLESGWQRAKHQRERNSPPPADAD